MRGSPAEPVEVVPYDPSWPATFAALRDRVAAAFGPLARAVEHVGSTAVPGLAGKPVVDLDVVVATPADVPRAAAHLAALGYAPKGEQGVPGRWAFAAPPGRPRHHLYVLADGAPALRDHLDFRDHLRAHPDVAAVYGALKETLARRHRHDRAAYGRAKDPFVAAALAVARAGPR